MGDADQFFRPLPRRKACQIDLPVFGDDVHGLGPRRRDDVATGKARHDVGMADAFLIDPARRHGQEGPAVFCRIGTGDEIELAAGPADLPRPCRFRTDLAIEVAGDAAVDGDEMVQLTNRFRIVDIMHRRRQDVDIMVQKIIELLRSVTDGKDAFPMLQGLALVGNLTGLVQVEITVTHKLCMHAQVFEVRFGNESSQGIGHAADAELQRVPVVDEGEYLGGNLLIQLTSSPAGSFTQRLIIFYDNIDIADVDMIIGHTVYERHIGIDFQDNPVGGFEHFLHAAVGQAVTEITVAIHGRYGYHGYVDRCLAAAVIGTTEAEHHRREESPPRIDILPVQSRAVPEIVCKGLMLRVLFYYLDRTHRYGMAYFDIGELIPAGSQGRIESRREGAGLAVIDPVTGPDELHRFFRSTPFFFIYIEWIQE